MMPTDQTAWRPIETAPDKEDILIFAPDADWGQTQYVGTKSTGSLGNFYFSLSGSNCQTGCGNTGTPTHWMPLPEAPK